MRHPKFYFFDLVISRPGEHPLLVEIKSTDLVEEKHVEALLSSGSHFENGTKQCVSNDTLAKTMSDVDSFLRRYIGFLYITVQNRGHFQTIMSKSWVLLPVGKRIETTCVGGVAGRFTPISPRRRGLLVIISSDASVLS